MNTPISWIKAYVPDLDCTGTGICRQDELCLVPM